MTEDADADTPREGSTVADEHGGPDRADDAGDDGSDRPGIADDDVAAPVDTETLAAHTTERRSLSPRVQIVWGLRMLFGAVILTFGISFVSMTVDPIPSWTGAAAGAVLLALGVAWVHTRYRVWTYEVRADAMYLERGVLTHVRTIAPYVRIQHVDTQRGPLERWLGLSTLVVYTAGTRGADVSIPGLTREEARDLQGRVKELAIHAEGGDAV